MSGVAIIRTLLSTNSALTAVVPETRVIGGTIPINTTLPCMSITEVSAVEVPTIDAQNSPDVLVDSLVQVTVMATNYPTQKQIHALVRKACNYKRGMLAGYSVVSVRRRGNGSDFSDPEAAICMQSIDFSVLYFEPN